MQQHNNATRQPILCDDKYLKRQIFYVTMLVLQQIISVSNISDNKYL